MLRRVTSILMAFAFVFVASAAENGELDKLQGKWEVKKTNEEGDKVTQVLEIKKDAMHFKILDASGETKLVAKATVKLQKAGAFKTLTISNIQAGEDEDSLGPADGERAYVYQLIDRTLTIVSNMDEARELPPTLDTYKKVSDAK